MPKVRPIGKPLSLETELIHHAHAHRLAMGWLVAREAGIEPDLSPVGHELMAKWSKAKNLPAMLKVFGPQAKLFYRIRALCLQLHNHPAAAVCGGPEQWWQRILEEDILGQICDHIGPKVIPELGEIAPTKPATVSWWMRRGLNPVNPTRRPACWALIEATQARCYRNRIETLRPSEDVQLPVEALNGELSLHQRKNLLERITGSREGWSLNHGIELTADWLEVLQCWQATTKDNKQQPKPQRHKVADSAQYDALAVAFHDALLPTWWANLDRIKQGLELIEENKPSDCNGFEGASKNEPKGFYYNANPGRLKESATKKDHLQSANPQMIPVVTEDTSKRFLAVSNSNPMEAEP